MKLLIVDDSSIIRRTIFSVYKNSVFTEIQTAADGVLAITAFRKLLPDVVTLDITMPHMDGLAALAKMLEIKPNTIVLIISALADHHTAIESLSRGAHQFICKPFTDDDLKEALDSLILENSSARNYTPESDIVIAEQIKSAGQVVTTHNDSEQPPQKEDYPSGYVQPPKLLTPGNFAPPPSRLQQKKEQLRMEKPPLPLKQIALKREKKSNL